MKEYAIINGYKMEVLGFYTSKGEAQKDWQEYKNRCDTFLIEMKVIDNNLNYK